MPRLQPPTPPAQTPLLGKTPIVPALLAKPETPAVTPPFALPSLATQSTDASQLQPSIQGSASPSISLEPEPQFILHKVKRGESLGKIAQQYLGSPNRHLEIYQANRDDLRNPNDLRIGMTLKIPVPTPVEQTPPPPRPERPAPVAPAPVAPSLPATETTFTQYTVKRGESLSSIALRTLGDSERYMEIYQANRDLLKDPDALRLGMQLKIPPRQQASSPNPETPQPSNPQQSSGAAAAGQAAGAAAVNASGLTPGAQELLAAMQNYQQHHAQLGNAGRTQTTPAQMREIAIELDSASKAFGVDPKMMLALFAHESGGINPGARSHTGAGGLGQLTSIAIRQVHFMAGIGKGSSAKEPYKEHKSNFVQNSRAIRERYDIKANVWTSVAYMSYELNDRARLGRGVEKALKRYGDPNVSTYANKVNAEYRTLFGGKLF